MDFFSAIHVVCEESFLHLTNILGGSGTRKLSPKADTIRSATNRKYRDKQNKIKTYFDKLNFGSNLKLDVWMSKKVNLYY